MTIDINQFEPITKGKSIYVYTSPYMELYYGSNYYDQIVEKYKDINFVFACCKQAYDILLSKKNGISKKYLSKYNIKYYEKDILINEIYPQCFVALRLTIHDGMAYTVQELGLMGIKSIHNGDSPSSLNYKNLDDICSHIDNELKTIGTCDSELANKVKKYLTLDKNFYNTCFYKNNIEK